MGRYGIIEGKNVRSTHNKRVKHIMQLSKKQARNFILAYQMLLKPRALRGKEGIHDYMKRVRCIQYDPLNVVGYNPHLVLQSRVKNFRGEHLNQLLYDDRLLVDIWDKNMSIGMTEDWPYFSRYRTEFRQRYQKDQTFVQEIEKVKTYLHDQGPSSSIDIKMEGKMDWSWAPARVVRAALESLFFAGEVMVYNKIGTRRIFDFTTHLLPETIAHQPDPNESLPNYFKWHVKRRIQSIGLLWSRSSYAYIAIRWMKSKDRVEALSRLEEEGELIPLTIDDMPYTFYIGKEDIALLEEVMTWTRINPQIAFLAPLDNLLWDRQLIRELFDFDYKWEVYTPMQERKFGYYVLPVLYGNQFIGRFEPKFQRKTNTLEIINWWWEGEIKPTKQLSTAIERALYDFMKYLGATRITLHTHDQFIHQIVDTLKDKRHLS